MGPGMDFEGRIIEVVPEAGRILYHVARDARNAFEVDELDIVDYVKNR
jgi:hypothetical protein